MKTLTGINSSRDMNPAGLDLNWVPEKPRLKFNDQLKGLAARIWAYLSWGQWTAIGLFVAAFAAALWLKSHW